MNIPRYVCQRKPPPVLSMEDKQQLLDILNKPPSTPKEVRPLPETEWVGLDEVRLFRGKRV